MVTSVPARDGGAAAREDVCEGEAARDRRPDASDEQPLERLVVHERVLDEARLGVLVAGVEPVHGVERGGGQVYLLLERKHELAI